MKLLTQEILHQFYVTGVQEDSPDPLVIAKFFCPWNQWTWYATEYHPSSRTFFGITV
ncbi:MAG: DUF2958 domain-containing protein [Candidatus Peribacteria bacterium]|nr:MAG: DUF2958 domain-containing protein [Candidatus Peribacteria bacterium]